MILNYEQVRQKGILTGSVGGNFNNAVYDIRIGKIITMTGDEVTTYRIPPQDMVVVVSTEQLTIPADIVGYAHVRTSLSSKGIMAINIGIIDPGYSGNLSSTLLNFGKADFLISEGDKFLRTTFHAITTPVAVDKLSSSKSLDHEHYMDRKKVETQKYMDEKFMSFDKEVSKSINKKFENFLRYTSLISACLAFLTFTINIIYNKIKPDPTEGYEYQLKINQAKYVLLENEHHALQARIDSMIKKSARVNLLPTVTLPATGTVTTKPSSNSK